MCSTSTRTCSLAVGARPGFARRWTSSPVGRTCWHAIRFLVRRLPMEPCVPRSSNGIRWTVRVPFVCTQHPAVSHGPRPHPCPERCPELRVGRRGTLESKATRISTLSRTPSPNPWLVEDSSGWTFWARSPACGQCTRPGDRRPSISACPTSSTRSSRGGYPNNSVVVTRSRTAWSTGPMFVRLPVERSSAIRVEHSSAYSTLSRRRDNVAGASPLTRK